MTSSRCSLGRRLAALASLSLAATGAQAALGDAASLLPVAGAVPLASSTAYVQRVPGPGGTTINEYVATETGTVFAYTWQGPVMPSLRTLLGSYEASYRNGASAQLAALTSLHIARVEHPDVVVETSGRMRSYLGRAWLPGALPAGVSEGDLR